MYLSLTKFSKMQTLVSYLQNNWVFPFYEKVDKDWEEGYVKNGMRLYFYDFNRKIKIIDFDEYFKTFNSDYFD